MGLRGLVAKPSIALFVLECSPSISGKHAKTDKNLSVFACFPESQLDCDLFQSDRAKEQRLWCHLQVAEDRRSRKSCSAVSQWTLICFQSIRDDQGSRD